MYVVLCALFIYFYLFSKVLLVLKHTLYVPTADAVTRKAVETGTRLHQTQ